MSDDATEGEARRGAAREQGRVGERGGGKGDGPLSLSRLLILELALEQLDGGRLRALLEPDVPGRLDACGEVGAAGLRQGEGGCGQWMREVRAGWVGRKGEGGRTGWPSWAPSRTA